MVVKYARRSFTVDEFEQMGRSGILGHDERVELLDGEVVKMSPIGSRHAGCVNKLTHFFVSRLAGKVVVSIQNPARLSIITQPQPDLTISRYRPDAYSEAHPNPEDILLVIEVADTTFDFDRNVKMPLYAEAGIGELWLIDLPGKCLHVYRQPVAAQRRFRQHRKYHAGDTVAPAALPDTELALAEILA